MTVSPNARAQASEYNSVAELVNKIFGDKYSSALPSDADRTNHKFGWGALNIDDAVAVGADITAERLQFMVDRTNVMIDHCDVADTILMFAVPNLRTTIDPNTLIRAEDLNVVENKINNTIIANNKWLTIDPTNASALIATPTAGGPYLRTTPWANVITSEHKWTFNSYNHARYFFNGGGQLRMTFEMSGGSTSGYYNWSDIVNEMGVLNFTWDNMYQSAGISPGISESKGFYALTEYYGDGSDAGTNEEGLLFTSSGVTISGYGYGYGYGYSGYSGYSNLRLKVYGKWANGGSEVHFKIVLDDTSYDTVIDGRIEGTCSYLMPDIISENTAEFDVTPDPVLEITDNFNTGDDS